MEDSFQLLSTMSPKVKKGHKPKKKVASVLALKKNIRRSSIFDKQRKTEPNDSIIIVDGGSSSETPSEPKKPNATTIEISDSDLSEDEAVPKKIDFKRNIQQDLDTVTLSRQKMNDIQDWIKNVNVEKKNDVTVFSEVSTIYGEELGANFKIEGQMCAASSTQFFKDDLRFDEMFKKREVDKKQDIFPNFIKESQDAVQKLSFDDSFEVKKTNSVKKLYIEDSFEAKEINDSFKKLYIEDSFEANNVGHRRSSSGSKKSEVIEISPVKTVDEDHYRDCEKLLDELYGDSWRPNQDKILPKTEPRKNKKLTPKTDKKPRQDKVRLKFDSEPRRNNILKEKQESSPWLQKLKGLCDPDSSPDNSPIKTSPVKTRLNFDDIDQKISKYFPQSNKENIPQIRVKKKSAPNLLKVLQTENLDKKTKGSFTRYRDDKSTSSEEGLTFLESLSGNVPIEKVEMSARIFRNNFKKCKNELTERLFKLFNKEVFDNSIPESTPFEWNDRLTGTAGRCRCKKRTRRCGTVERSVVIELSTKVITSADRLRDILVHELCHAATWLVNEVCDGHGKYWKHWAYKANKRFPELPPITVCHNYAINTKYTYKCVDCGYSFGRHSKSLNLATKRCGYCLGRFEVYINKTNKKGETNSVPSTPKRNPSPFACFIKENYSNFRTPDRKHGDVMKLLGQKFAELKPISG